MAAEVPTAETTPRTPIRRPLGVWVVTTWLFLFAGVFPIGVALFMYFAPQQRTFAASGLAVSVAVSTAMTVASIVAWLGYAWSRFLLIALTVVFYGLIAYNLYTLGASGAIPEHRMHFVWTRMARSLIIMTLVVLYLLLNQNARQFFRNYRRDGAEEIRVRPSPKSQ